jgi:hypothetical protein
MMTSLITAFFVSVVSSPQESPNPVANANRTQMSQTVATILNLYPQVQAAAASRGVTQSEMGNDERLPRNTPRASAISFYTKSGVDFSVSTRTGLVFGLSITGLGDESGVPNFTAEQELSRIQQIWNSLGYLGSLRVAWQEVQTNGLRAEYQPVVAGAEFPVDAPVGVFFRPVSRVPNIIWISGVPALNVETSPLATDTQVEQAVAANAFPESGFSAVHLTLGQPFYSRWSEMSLGKTQFTPDDLAIRQEGKAVLIRQVIMADVGSYNPATQEFARWQVVYVRAKTGRVMARIDYAGMSGGQTPGVKGKRPVFNPRQVSFGDFRGSLTPMRNVKFASKPESVTIRSGGGLWRAEYEASSGLVRLVQGDLWFRR